MEDSVIDERTKKLCKEFGLSYHDNLDTEDLLWAIMDKLSNISEKQNRLIRYLSTITIVPEGAEQYCTRDAHHDGPCNGFPRDVCIDRT